MFYNSFVLSFIAIIITFTFFFFGSNFEGNYEWSIGRGHCKKY